MEQKNLDTVPVEERRVKNEPEWHKGSLDRRMREKITHNIKNGVQQTDNLKPFYNSHHHPVEKTKKPRKVIIVGAGMAGLSAAYELRRVGHSVQILEMTQRAGGRVKTFGEPDGFAKGLYVDGKGNRDSVL